MTASVWRMPAEWEPHERTWMAWPHAGYTLGVSKEEQNEARQTWAAVANAIVAFEPVTVVVDPSAHAVASQYLDERIEIVLAQLDDAWMRDIGPSFVFGTTGELSGKLGAVNWVFNGWGQQPWASWKHDSQIGSLVSQLTPSISIDSPLINEGGGFHVNGAGTVMVTETVQLGAGRNETWSRSEVESELKRTIGAHTVIWLERGLTRDYDQFGTRGHVDIVACFANENTILYHDQQNPEHPDYRVTAQVKSTLESAGSFELIGVPAPTKLRDDEGWVDYSYINHYLVNGGVILCSFDDPADARAAEILSDIYPTRKIVQIDAQPLFARGGGIHCITQQQPK